MQMTKKADYCPFGDQMPKQCFGPTIKVDDFLTVIHNLHRKIIDHSYQIFICLFFC
jgi:hypothetical protein